MVVTLEDENVKTFSYSSSEECTNAVTSERVSLHLNLHSCKLTKLVVYIKLMMAFEDIKGKSCGIKSWKPRSLRG